MKSDFKRRAVELYKEGIKNQSEVARIVAKEFGLFPTKNFTRKVQHAIHKNIGIIDECERVGIDIDNVKRFWHKSKHYSIEVVGDKKEFNYNDFREDFISEISKWSPQYRTISRERVTDGHCLLFDPADIHIGKLCSSFETGEDYNQQIAVKRVREGLNGIIQKSNGWNIDKIIFVAGNDVLHTDTPKRTTTSGTPQDTDGMWYENFLTAKRLLVEIIETLMMIADVEVVYNPSNHDYMSGFMLLDSVT